MDQFKNVPFGNSVFQIMNFTDGSETPERRYRHCLLQLNQKYNALKECEFRRARLDIDIEEIEFKLELAEGFDKKRLEIDLAEKQHNLDIEVKLIDDCIVEVSVYNHILEQLPNFTREEFEEGEYDYWKKRLLGDARREMISTGTISPQVIASLDNMGLNISKNDKGQIVYAIGDKNDSDNLCIDKTNTN